MKKALLSAFNESIERGKSEEIGSIDILEVDGQTYFVNKTGRDTYALFEEDSMTPLAEKSTHKKVRAIFQDEMYRLAYLNGKPVDVYPDDEEEDFRYSFGILSDVEDYCSDKGLNIVSYSGI